MKKIGIIIVNFFGEKDTNELLESLEKIKHINFAVKIYIIDNGSRDDFICSERLRSFTTIIKNTKNLGFASANNQGMKLALKDNADYICLLNNDTTVSPDFLDNLFSFFEKNKSVGIASPKIYFSKGHEFHENRYKEEEKGKVIWYAGGVIDWQNVYCSHMGVNEVDNGQHDKVTDTDFATGCCMFLRRELLEKIGFFDEKYFAYFEDVDLCVRAHKAGYEIKYIGSSTIWHKNASSSGGSGSSLQFFLQERNRLYFGFKYASLNVKLHLGMKFFAFLFSKNYKISLSLIKMFI